MSYDPATKADKARALVYAVALLGIVLTLGVSFCLRVHGMG